MSTSFERWFYEFARRGADTHMEPSPGDALGQRINPNPEYLKAPWGNPAFQAFVANKTKALFDDLHRTRERTFELERDIQGFRTVLKKVFTP